MARSVHRTRGAGAAVHDRGLYLPAGRQETRPRTVPSTASSNPHIPDCEPSTAILVIYGRGRSCHGGTIRIYRRLCRRVHEYLPHKRAGTRMEIRIPRLLYYWIVTTKSHSAPILHQ